MKNDVNLIINRIPDRQMLSNNYNASVFSKSSKFYHFEPGIVLDIILDNSHPMFAIASNGGVNGMYQVPMDNPVNYKNDAPTDKDISYKIIGCIWARLCMSQQNVEKEDVVFAYPLDNSFTNYPLMNEVVQVTFYNGRYYYSNSLTLTGFKNSQADFRLESSFGKNNGNRQFESVGGNLKGPISNFDSSNAQSYPSMRGILGNYFLFNNKIRNLRRREGDTIVESRFGQSIRFGSYDDNRYNDIGTGFDYAGDGKSTNSFSNTLIGGGNPFILIRNRQRPVAKDKDFKVYPRINAISKIENNLNEKNADGYIIEDVNNDGSSIHLTSGLTISRFTTTCYKSTFSNASKTVLRGGIEVPVTNGVVGNSEEQPAFSPLGSSNWIRPILDGNQIVINSDRLVLSSKSNEILIFSKGRYAVTTDSEYTVDAHSQIVLNTNNKTVINSPAIYLGQYDVTDEPCLLGQTTVNWMYDLCQWLLEHTHWYKHSHPDAGNADPDRTQRPVQRQELIDLRDALHTLMSRRVFITGGGFAKGANGGYMRDENGGQVSGQSAPVGIDVASGAGVPGGWKGENHRGE